jgi:hypothetical protein
MPGRRQLVEAVIAEQGTDEARADRRQRRRQSYAEDRQQAK